MNSFLLLSLLGLILPLSYCGKAVISGGDIELENAALYQSFIDLSTVNGQHKIGVVTNGISWSISESIAKQIRNRLIRYGAVADNVEWIPWHKDNGNSCTDSTLAAKVSQYTGIFFNGGTTSWIYDCFVQNGNDVAALTNMRNRYAANQLAIMGSSAGALVLTSVPMPGIRESYTALRSGASVSDEGFHLFDHGFIDVHFSSRGRQGRLIRLVEQLHQYETVGFGIDENTAMVIRGNEFEVQGTRGVYIFDVSEADNVSGKRFAVNNVKGSYLNYGDKYNFLTKTVTFASTKRALVPNDVSAKYTPTIFLPGMFTTLTTRLFMAGRSTRTYGLTEETTPRFRLDFRKTSQSSAYIGASLSTATIGYKDLFIDIYCSANC